MDRTAHRQRTDDIGVAVQQNVHTGPRDEVVPPDAAPGRAHELIGQPITGARPTAPARYSLHRQGTAAITHPQLRHQPDRFGDQAAAAGQRGHKGDGERRQAAAQRRRGGSRAYVPPGRALRLYLRRWPGAKLISS